MLQKILYVHYGDDWVRGSERCVLDLMTHLNKQTYEPILWCNSDVLANHAKKAGIRTYQSNFRALTESSASLNTARNWYQLVAKAIHLIRTHEIAVIHANSVAPCRWMSVASLLTNTPIIGHYHTQYLARERFSSLSHWVDRIVGVSQDVLKPYEQDGCNGSACQVIYNGIDHQALEKDQCINLEKRFGITADDYSLLSVGALVKRKGYASLIRAITELNKQGLSVKCVIVGDGDDRNNLEQMIKQADMDASIFLVGWCDDVGKYYHSNFDAFISASTHEAFGLVNVEAAFCNKPVIAPNIGGLNEIFAAGVSAELFSCNTPSDIANSIARVLLDPVYRKKLQQIGAQVVHEKFTIQRYVSQFETLYRQLILSGGGMKPSVIQYLKSIFKARRRSMRQRLNNQVMELKGG